MSQECLFAEGFVIIGGCTGNERVDMFAQSPRSTVDDRLHPSRSLYTTPSSPSTYGLGVVDKEQYIIEI